MRPQLGAVSLPAWSESVTQKRYEPLVVVFGAFQDSPYACPAWTPKKLRARRRMVVPFLRIVILTATSPFPAPTRKGSFTDVPRRPDVGRACTVRIGTSSIRKLCVMLCAGL